MDISDEKLNTIFEDLTNKHLLMYTTKKIRQLIKNVIDEIDIPVATRQLFIQKLQLYKFVDEINHLKYGAYIRWIPIHVDTSEIDLNVGAIFCESKISDNGIIVMCKNIYNHKIFNLMFDDHLFFQKLTKNEKIFLAAMDCLQK